MSFVVKSLEHVVMRLEGDTNLKTLDYTHTTHQMETFPHSSENHFTFTSMETIFTTKIELHVACDSEDLELILL